MMGPTIAVIVLLAAGITDFDAAVMIEHVAMFPAMLAVMLARWDEYSASHDHQQPRSRNTEPATPSCPAESAYPLTFVTGGIEGALAQARAAAEGKDVLVAGGADLLHSPWLRTCSTSSSSTWRRCSSAGKSGSSTAPSSS